MSTSCLARAIFFIAALTALASAQNTPVPGPQFQYASMTGSGNVITLTRVPVTTSSGQVVYQDISIQFDNDGNGNLNVTAGFPTFNPSPNLLVSSFQTGTYVAAPNVAHGKAAITINGPGVSTGGSTTWSSIATSSADPCTYPGSATWYVGPIDNNPLSARLKKVGITSTAWTYGVLGSGVAFSCGVGFTWGNGAIVGVSQVGNTITFASFTNNGSDSASPVDQITYTLSPVQQ
jgi:hypothetical protein